MKQFKEWVSDYLRYILLLIGALLAFTIITFGVQTWLIIRNGDYVSGETTQNGSGGKGAIEILTESESEPESASEPESESETEPESETEIAQDETSSEISAETQNETEKQTETSPVTERQTEKKSNSAKPQMPSKTQPESEKKPETQPVTERETQPVTERETQPVTERQTQPPTEPPTETEYVPVYKTLKGSCYIRSGPSYEAEIIGEYMYGTTVEFLEDVGGWYKVQIDGMVGYMGARFF